MKKFIAFMFVMGMALLTVNATFAQDADQPKMTDEEVAAMESEFFMTFDAESEGGDAKALLESIEEDGDADAKCCFWGFRRYYYYPTYCYYGWYCPWYYVRLRLITYTVPVVHTAVASDVAVADTEVVYKSSGKCARGVVISEKIPSNSPLAKLGLRAGDIITKIDGKPVNSLIDLKKMDKNSKISVQKGKGIKIAKKQLSTGSGSKASADAEDTIEVDSLKKVQNQTLYEYFDSLEESDEI